MPALTDIEGCLGMSMLVDRGSGRCIATSSWRDEGSRRASEGPVRKLRDDAAEVFHGTTEVSQWEIAVMHRDHHSDRGACCRVTWIKTEPAHIDRGVDMWKMAALPKMEELDGFCSASLMLDRAAEGISAARVLPEGVASCPRGPGQRPCFVLTDGSPALRRRRRRVVQCDRGPR